MIPSKSVQKSKHGNIFMERYDYEDQASEDPLPKT